MLVPSLAKARLAAAAGFAGDDPRLLVVHLRGGLDALAALPPYGDPYLAAIRGSSAAPEDLHVPPMLRLDGLFGLHPSLAPLLPHYLSGEMLVVPATGIAGAARSHAEAQAALFDHDGSGAGWLDRIPGKFPRRPLQVWRTDSGHHTLDMLSDLVLANPRLLGDILRTQDQPDDLMSVLERRIANAGADFEQTARSAATALSAEDGPRLAFLELEGFDAHVAQGAARGRLANALDALACGLVSFARECGPVWRQTAVLVTTEFGRTLSFNANGGTDHGSASVTFVMGGAVSGGRVGGNWPGLALPGDSNSLAPTTDLRSIIKAVVTDHLKVPRHVADHVLPHAASVPAMTGLFRLLTILALRIGAHKSLHALPKP